MIEIGLSFRHANALFGPGWLPATFRSVGKRVIRLYLEGSCSIFHFTAHELVAGFFFSPGMEGSFARWAVHKIGRRIVGRWISIEASSLVGCPNASFPGQALIWARSPSRNKSRGETNVRASARAGTSQRDNFRLAFAHS